MFLQTIVIAAVLAGNARSAPAQVDGKRLDLAQSKETAMQAKGTVQGHKNAIYLIHLDAGTSVRITLTASTKSAYFNIYAPGTTPGKAEAVYVSALHDNQTTFKATQSGDYVVQIYNFRNAARNRRKSSYLLSIQRAP